MQAQIDSEGKLPQRRFFPWLPQALPLVLDPHLLSDSPLPASVSSPSRGADGGVLGGTRNQAECREARHMPSRCAANNSESKEAFVFPTKPNRFVFFCSALRLPYNT